MTPRLAECGELGAASRMTLKIGMKWDGECDTEFPLVDLKDAIADNADLRGDRYRNDAALWTTAGPMQAELGPSSEIRIGLPGIYLSDNFQEVGSFTVH
jgi:hypothetical protein